MQLKPKLIKLTSETRLYGTKVPIVGVTGGIATGKSSVTDILRAKGFFVICADELVKEVRANQEMVDFVKLHSPSAVKDNKVDYKILRANVFSDDSLKEKIENYIYQKLPAAFAGHRDSSNADIIFYDVPLLFEKSLDELIDVSACVYAPRDEQVKRLSKRDNTDKETIDNILASQLDIEIKAQKSNFVIENTKDLKHLEVEVDKFLEALKP